jgi:hypothetical protein
LIGENSFKKWSEGTQEKVDFIIEIQKESLSCFIDDEYENFQIKFDESSQVINNLIKNLSVDLNKNGFVINIRAPNFNKNKIFEYSSFSILENGAIKENPRTNWKKREGWWASLVNSLNEEWGADKEIIKEYIIDKGEVKKIVNQKVESALTVYKNNIYKEIINPLNSAVDDFFSDMKIILVNIQSDFEQGIKDNQKQQCEKNLLLENISSLLKQSHEAYKDCNDLSIDVSNLKSVR